MDLPEHMKAVLQCPELTDIFVKECFTHQPDLYRPELFAYIGDALLTRFQQTESVEYLNRAIAAHRDAVRSTLNIDGDRGKFLNDYSAALLSRFLCTGSMEDWNQANAA